MIFISQMFWLYAFFHRSHCIYNAFLLSTVQSQPEVHYETPSKSELFTIAGVLHLRDKVRGCQLDAQQGSKGLKELTSCHSICPLVFGSIVPFKCLFHCSMCFCCFMPGDQTWAFKTWSKSCFLPDCFIVVDTVFVEKLNSFKTIY